MLAVDTNVIVRYLANDDPRQSSIARKLIESRAVFVSTTVLLETEWVLRISYRFAPLQICQALRTFVGLPNVSVQDSSLTALALDRMEAGMDFADALHLGESEDVCESFVTFDRDLLQTARNEGIATVRGVE